MAIEGQVLCVTKRVGKYAPHQRISHIGGRGWRHTVEEAIANIEAGRFEYFVADGWVRLDLQIATNMGQRYLKSVDDGYAPNSLLKLPECPQ